MDETLGKWSFWVIFAGFNLGFFPMHVAGLMGMPRRIYTYAPDMGWNTVNMVSFIGSFIFAVGILVFLVSLLLSLKRGTLSGENPWDAPTLEWATSSPPPPYNFAVIPHIASGHPLWEDCIPEGKNRSNIEEGYLLFSYFYLDAQAEQRWPPEGLPELPMPVLNTLLLLSSSVFVWLCERCVRQNRIRRSLGFMTSAIILGAAFVAIQLKEWSKNAYGPASNIYGSLYFTITGFHMLHVIIGLVILSLLMLWIGLGYFNERRNKAIAIGGLYWHFVDAVWLFIFTSFFVVPSLHLVRHEQGVASLCSIIRRSCCVDCADVTQRAAGRRCLLRCFVAIGIGGNIIH